MEWFKNLKIANKLKVLVICASFFVIVTSLVGYIFNAKATKSLNDLYTRHLVAVSNIQELNGNLNRIMADILNLFQYTTNAEAKALDDDINNLKSKNTTLLDEYLATKPTKEELDLFEKIKEMRSSFWGNISKEVALAKQNKNEQAYAIYKSNNTFLEEYRTILTELAQKQKDISKEVFEANEVASRTSSILTVVIGVFSLLLLITLGSIISSMITKPIQQAVEELDNGANQVASASSQLSSASEQLASGTAEQAAAIQETSASVEESESMIRQNSDNTQQAAVMAKKAKDFANKSATEMDKMILSMGELKKSSDDIAKIIKVIDEIAFQTNILALNAAVEAARAGDAGKGFAVVAEEVRNLAQKSAQATKDTAKIIENNITLSKENVEMTQSVNENIKQIDIEAQKVSELLSEIAVASQEQSQGIEQITKAIKQMEQVVQANASTSEESASASRELSSQADSVKEIVNTLFVMVEGTDILNNKMHKDKRSFSNSKPQRPASVNASQLRSNLKIPSKNQSPENIIPLSDDF